MITEGNVQVDTGANASAEEAEEALEDTEQKVNNIVHSFRLQSTAFDKKGYLAYLKGEFRLLFSPMPSSPKTQKNNGANQLRK